MQSEKLKEVCLGVFVLGISIVGFLFVNPTNAPVTEGPGGLSWRTVPYIYSGLLMGLALLFLAITIIRGPIPVDPAKRDVPLLPEGVELCEGLGARLCLFVRTCGLARRARHIGAQACLKREDLVERAFVGRETLAFALSLVAPFVGESLFEC